MRTLASRPITSANPPEVQPGCPVNGLRIKEFGGKSEGVGCGVESACGREVFGRSRQGHAVTAGQPRADSAELSTGPANV